MDIRNVDLNLLVVLDTLLRVRSVSRAAEALDLSQPAVSFALARLRKMFDDPLFVRASRSMQPTPRVLQLAGPLRSVLDSIKNDMLQPPAFDPAIASRTFVFNMTDIGELVFLPRLVKQVQRVAPGVEIKSISIPPGELESALQSGEVDFALGYFPYLHSAALYQQRLLSHVFVCVMRVDNPMIGKEITRKQFLEAKHAVVRGTSDELVEQALAKLGLTRHVVLRVSHYLGIPMIVAESDLIVTVPYAVGLSFAKMAPLKTLRPPINIGTADVKHHWHARFHHDPANKWMREEVATLFFDESRRTRRVRS